MRGTRWPPAPLPEGAGLLPRPLFTSGRVRYRASYFRPNGPWCPAPVLQPAPRRGCRPLLEITGQPRFFSAGATLMAYVSFSPLVFLSSLARWRLDWRRPDRGDRTGAVVGDAGAPDLAWPGSQAAARCVTPGSLSGSRPVLRVRVLVVAGIVGDKLVVNHRRSPAP